MKMTKGRIRQIIKEEIEALAGEEGYKPEHAALSAWLEKVAGPDLGKALCKAVESSPHKDEVFKLADELIIAEGEEE